MGLRLARRLLDESDRCRLLLFSFRALPLDRSLHVSLDKVKSQALHFVVASSILDFYPFLPAYRRSCSCSC